MPLEAASALTIYLGTQRRKHGVVREEGKKEGRKDMKERKKEMASRIMLTETKY